MWLGRAFETTGVTREGMLRSEVKWLSQQRHAFWVSLHFTGDVSICLATQSEVLLASLI